MKRKIIIFSIMFLLIDEASKIILDNVLSLGKSITIFDKFLYITKIIFMHLEYYGLFQQ